MPIDHFQQVGCLKTGRVRDHGSYSYFCTFPGHWTIMRGVMIVE